MALAVGSSWQAPAGAQDALDVSASVVTGRDGISGFVDNVPPDRARFSGISAISGTASDLWIADTNNHRIRRLVARPGSYTVGLTGVREDAPREMVTTIAGTGVAGSSGDGLHPLQAQLNRPAGIDVCSYRHYDAVYVSDTGNNKVRRIVIYKLPNSVTVTTAPSARVNLPDAQITTVAGTGVAGYSDGGGHPLAAMLNGPRDIRCTNRNSSSTGTQGQVVTFADTRNHVIRQFQVDAAGTPLAGTMGVEAGTPGVRGYSGDGSDATKARLNFPTGFAACNNSGGWMIADTGNNRVRRLEGAPTATLRIPPDRTQTDADVGGPETITTFAGTGVPGSRGDGLDPASAQLNGPTDVLCSRSRTSGWSVSILDAGNRRIRRVTPAQRIVVSTAPSVAYPQDAVVGTLVGAPGTPLVLRNPQLFQIADGDAIDDMFVASSGGHVVRRIEVA